MLSLFNHNPLAFGAWTLGLILIRVMESVVDIRTFKRLRTGIRRHDKGSHLTLLGLVVGGILLAVLTAFTVSATAITLAPDFFLWLGIFLIYAGLALRFYAITVLGAFFTATVAVAPEQTVIQTGPYRFIRHPSYTGFLILLLGFGLSLLNWLSLLVMMVCALIGFGYRIRVEEQALQAQLGQPYQEYMQHTKRLIPFVL